MIKIILIILVSSLLFFSCRTTNNICSNLNIIYMEKTDNINKETLRNIIKNNRVIQQGC